MENYDSTYDTLIHKKNIEHVLLDVLIPELEKRAKEHDNSKLVNPEKETYDKYIPILKQAKYGTVEYLKIREAMKEEGLKHHFKANRHHPEHYPNNDISHMTLVDLIEMFADHYASSLRSDTGYVKGEKINKDQYHYDDQIYQIMINTYNEYFK